MEKIKILLIIITFFYITVLPVMAEANRFNIDDFYIVSVKIKEIKKTPYTFAGKYIQIEGKVIKSINLFAKLVEIDDNTDKIFIKMKQDVLPEDGDVIKVLGKIKQVKIGGLNYLYLEEK